MKYILAIDQSTSQTKLILFNKKGMPVIRKDMPHRQIVNEKGWVEHDPEEIYGNLITGVKEIINSGSIKAEDIEAAALSNQRERPENPYTMLLCGNVAEPLLSVRNSLNMLRL